MFSPSPTTRSKMFVLKILASAAIVLPMLSVGAAHAASSAKAGDAAASAPAVDPQAYQPSMDPTPKVDATAAANAARMGQPPLTDAQFAERGRAFDARQRALDARTTKMNYIYAVAQHDCYAKFFVNSCLSKARHVMRDEQGEIRTEQLALSAERRDDRARQRVQDDEAKRARAVAQAPQRQANERKNRAAFEAKQQQHAVDMAKRGQDAPQRAANVDAYNRKQQAHQQALLQAQQSAAADAEKRAQNVARYEQKQAAALKRQQELDARRQQAAQRAAQAASQPGAAKSPGNGL